MKLSGKKAVVTGANQGLGLEAACAFAAQGADVMICARDEQKLALARSRIEAIAKGKVESMSVDVSQPQQVRQFVERTLAELGGLDILFANAGVYGPKGPMESVDLDQWVQAIEINLLGVVYCCREALPVMKRQRRGKILIAGGGGATKAMPNFSAYAASKAGVVRLAETLAEEVQEFGIDVNVVAPGALNTRLLEEVLEAGPEKVGQKFFAAALRQHASGGDSTERAADLCVFLAGDESDGITGKLISAKWDPWEQLPGHLADLKGSDIYTLRRIVPADRGKNWGER